MLVTSVRRTGSNEKGVKIASDRHCQPQMGTADCRPARIVFTRPLSTQSLEIIQLGLADEGSLNSHGSRS